MNKITDNLLSTTIFLTFTLLLLSQSTNSQACLPLTEQAVVIGRLEAIHKLDDSKSDNAAHAYEIELATFTFPFKQPCGVECWFGAHTEPNHWYSDFDVSIAQGDLLIGLADSVEGRSPQDYQFATMAHLSCSDNKISIGKPLVPYHGWNKQTHNCSYDPSQPNGIFDGFFEGNQQSYLQQLQTMYPTCDKLTASFPELPLKDANSNSTITDKATIKSEQGILAWLLSKFP